MGSLHWKHHEDEKYEQRMISTEKYIYPAYDNTGKINNDDIALIKLLEEAKLNGNLF
jgi:hypothetical protein